MVSLSVEPYLAAMAMGLAHERALSNEKAATAPATQL
jgi:hypothetical protein